MKKAIDIGLIKSSMLVCIGNVASQTIAFLIFVVMAWIFDSTEYGYIRWVIQIGTFLSVLCCFGIPIAVASYIAKEKNKSTDYIEIYFTNVFVILLFASLITLILSIILFRDILTWIICISLTVPTIYYGFARGLSDHAKITLINVVKNSVKLIMILFIFVLPLLRNASYIIFSYFVGGILSVYIMEKIRPLHMRLKMKRLSVNVVKKILKFSLFAFIGTVGYSLILTLCYIVLESRYSYISVALFSAASTILTIVTFIPNAVHTVLMPKIAESEKDRLSHFRQGMIITLLSSLIVLISILIFGKALVNLFFGSEYLESYDYIIWMSGGFFFANIRNAFTILWEGINRPEITSIDVVIGAIVTGITGIILTSEFGPSSVGGAFFLGFLAATIVNLIFYYKCKNLLNNRL